MGMLRLCMRGLVGNDSGDEAKSPLYCLVLLGTDDGGLSTVTITADPTRNCRTRCFSRPIIVASLLGSCKVYTYVPVDMDITN